MDAMTIVQASRSYEMQLATQTSLVQSDLLHKHRLMKKDELSFFRATFYRWMQCWPAVCSGLTTAPVVLAVGDLHVENFGTWLDGEGRLIWGINDFDEAYPLPYTNDLVRLAVSAKLAIMTEYLTIKPKDACDAILTGYREGLKAGGRPFVLAERHQWLRDIATGKLRDSAGFWRTIKRLPPVKGAIPPSARAALERLMPEPGLPYSIRRRVSGVGSLGRPRYVAVADWYGGKIVREAKALVPSACVWAHDGNGTDTILYQSLLDHAVRCRDPLVHVEGGWIVRRLSPSCSRIELASLPKKRDEARLLYAMGWETANIHLGSRKMHKVLRRDLAKRKADWLRVAAKTMTKATLSDWKDWVQR
jgi:uncharacterized protein DUF2252